jgi:hypothetical protein
MRRFFFRFILFVLFFFIVFGFASSNVKAMDANSFQILVDTNQIYPIEALQASKFAADGLWTIPVNSIGVDWNKMFTDINAQQWTISEDNPTATLGVDQTSDTLGRMVDGAMMYNEDGLATPLTDTQIEAYSSHIVPNFGPIDNRLVLLTRTFKVTDPRRNQIIHALQSSKVSGATFEFNPEGAGNESYDEGCKYILSLGKKCYLLMPPSNTTTDYLGDIQRAVGFFANAGLVNNPNVYFVIALYAREYTSVHFVSTALGDRNSIESVVKWLKEYRNQKPVGYQDGVANSICKTTGWALDQDIPSTSIAVHIYANGPAGTGTLLGGYVTDQTRPDVNNAMNVTGNHGFNINFNPHNSNEAILFDNQPHQLYVYAIDGQDNIYSNMLLSSSPKTIICQPPSIRMGDLNNDGSVDIIDLGIVVDDYDKSPISNTKADVNSDGSVDIIDIGILIDNYGK